MIRLFHDGYCHAVSVISGSSGDFIAWFLSTSLLALSLDHVGYVSQAKEIQVATSSQMGIVYIQL